MKTGILNKIAIAAVACLGCLHVSAQTVQSETINTEIKPLITESFDAFKKSVKPLINEMGSKRIIGLGEGTHGTAEFYKLRFWISRILIEEKGFRNIAFENDLSDVWFLNQKLAATDDVKQLMKNHLMSIWQNQEIRELLEWVKVYNSKYKQKVVISGVDYPLLKPDVDMLLALLNNEKYETIKSAVQKISQAAALQDEAWIGMNDKTYKADMKAVAAGSKRGYAIADSLEKSLPRSEMQKSLLSELKLALTNLKQGFAPFYSAMAEGDRDSIMAHNASLMLKTPKDKMIIWAHNAHLGKSKIYDGAVGGTGGYLLKLFPDNYFVLATGTATGTFSGTLDSRPTNSNPMKSNELEKPTEGSWESLLSEKGSSFYFNTARFNPNRTVKPLRFIGYGTKSGASTYDKSNLADFFDAFLFLKHSTAATPLKF